MMYQKNITLKFAFTFFESSSGLLVNFRQTFSFILIFNC